MERERCDSNFFANKKIGEVLNLLLGMLPVSEGTVSFIREVLIFILRSIGNLLCHLDFSDSDRNERPVKVDPNQIEACAKNIRKIMDFFDKGEKERRLFKTVFPRWKGKREKNIAQLQKITDSIHTSKKACSTAQIVGGSIGVIGGVALVGSLFFPPAVAFVLPGWLGGAAATALIPSVLLPTAATSVSTGVAIGGGIAGAAGGVTQLVSSGAEVVLLSRLVDEAKEVCERDRETFDFMMKWFRRTKDMEDALKNIFGSDVTHEAIFGDIMKFCGMEEFDESKMHFTSTLKSWSAKIMYMLGKAGLSDPYVRVVITSVLFVVFVIERRNRFLLSCVVAVQRVGLAVASTSLDAASIVLNAIDLAKGSKSKEQESVLEAVGMMKDELEMLEEVYKELRRNELYL